MSKGALGVQPVALGHLQESLRTSLWFIPTVCVLAAISLAIFTGWLDDTIDTSEISGLLVSSSPESARSFLTTISSSMITFTGLVFSITIVVLQLASAQFSPRVLRTFLRDRLSQLSLGIFVATFTYSLLILREVRAEGEVAGLQHDVPRISTAVAFLLVLLSIGFFVSYINHIAQSIRVSHIIASVGSETRALFKQIFDHPDVSPARTDDHPREEPAQVVESRHEGVILAVDRDGLVDIGRETGSVIRIVPGVGEFVPRGAPLYEIHGHPISPERLLELIDLGVERTMQQDPAFGFRQLVDIAEKALSPAINDPTTAVQAMDQMHDLLRHIADLPFPNGERRDENGDLRVIYEVVGWDEYVHLALDEIRHFGGRSVQVVKRMRWILEDLLQIAPPERKPVLEQELALLKASSERAFPDDPDVVWAARPDGRGLA